MSITPIKILLVEDNPGDIELTLVCFEEARLINTLTVIRDGQQAIDFFERGENLPDIVLLDINLPKVDGLEILNKIRTKSNSKNIPVIMLTSSESKSDILKSHDQKANNYIVKPIGFDNFHQVIKTLEMFCLTVLKSTQPISNEGIKTMRSIEILLVEDNLGDVELTKEALNEGKINNKLNVVNDGEMALEYVYKRGVYQDATTPDIILLDLNLPKYDGREVLQQLKSDPATKHIPIIILSSSEAAHDIQQSYDLHANCFVTKPIQLDDFIKVVQMIESFWIDIVKLPCETQH